MKKRSERDEKNKKKMSLFSGESLFSPRAFNVSIGHLKSIYWLRKKKKKKKKKKKGTRWIIIEKETSYGEWPSDGSEVVGEPADDTLSQCCSSYYIPPPPPHLTHLTFFSTGKKERSSSFALLCWCVVLLPTLFLAAVLFVPPTVVLLLLLCSERAVDER